MAFKRSNMNKGGDQQDHQEKEGNAPSDLPFEGPAEGHMTKEEREKSKRKTEKLHGPLHGEEPRSGAKTDQ